MTPEDFKALVLAALRHKQAEALMDDDAMNLAKVGVCIKIVERLDNEAIEAILTQMFIEAKEKFNA